MSLGANMDVRFGATVEEFVEYLVELGLEHVGLTTEYLQTHPDAPDPETVGEITAAYDVSVTYRKGGHRRADTPDYGEESPLPSAVMTPSSWGSF